MDELRIIKYLDGEMTGEELREFELQISMNPPLADEVSKYREIQELADKLLGEPESELKDPGRDIVEEIDRVVNEYKADPDSYGNIPPKFRKELDLAGKNYRQRKRQGNSMITVRRIWFSAAAVAVFAIILSIIFFRPFSSPEGSEIFSQYNVKLRKTDAIIEMARNDNDFLFAQELYEAGDYGRAAVLFEMLADSAELRSWSLLYAGSSYMFTNQTVKAIGILQQVISEGKEDEEVVASARWRLALCFLKNGQSSEAVYQLELLRENPEYRRDANHVLRILR